MGRKILCERCGGLGTFWTERWDEEVCVDCHGKGKKAAPGEELKNCEICAGMGVRLVRHSDIKPCPYCLGRGHLEAMDATPARESNAVNRETPPE